MIWESIPPLRVPRTPKLMGVRANSWPLGFMFELGFGV